MGGTCYVRKSEFRWHKNAEGVWDIWCWKVEIDSRLSRGTSRRREHHDFISIILGSLYPNQCCALATSEATHIHGAMFQISIPVANLLRLLYHDSSMTSREQALISSVIINAVAMINFSSFREYQKTTRRCGRYLRRLIGYGMMISNRAIITSGWSRWLEFHHPAKIFKIKCYFDLKN